MIITSLVETVAYRVHQPRWAFDPISGAGAAAEGGRANRKGLHALYLALDPQTALAEYQQRSSLLRPGTLVSYRISVQKIVDFSAGFTKDWPHQWREFFCDWSALCFGQGIEPPSWRLGDDVLATGAGGLLFRSNRRVEGLNLVIYTEHLGAADWIEVHDPGKDLPRDQTSWNE